MTERCIDMEREIPGKTVSRVTIREENFGYTLYDHNTLRHKLLDKDELDTELQKKQIVLAQAAYLPIKHPESRSDILYSPHRIYYELTLGCNLRCGLCFNSSGIPRDNELTTEEVVDSLQSFREDNVIDLRFTGGELTSRPDWIDILQEAKDLGFVVSCNTNGVYKNASIPRAFADLDLDQVTLSLDGWGENHDQHRGRTTFDQTVNSIKEMHGLGVKLRINTLITQLSLQDAEALLELASQYTEEINFFVPLFVGRGADKAEELGVTQMEVLTLSNQISLLSKKYPDLRVLHFQQSSQKMSVNGNSSKRLRKGPPSGFTNMNVTSDGQIWAGGYTQYIDPEKSLGNVREDSMYDIWQNSEKLEAIRKQAAGISNFCDSCSEFAVRCQGGKYEIELNRLINPQIENEYCALGSGPSLIKLSEVKII